MTSNTLKTLLGLMEEYRQSLDRVQGEKDLMRCIEARARPCIMRVASKVPNLTVIQDYSYNHERI